MKTVFWIHGKELPFLLGTLLGGVAHPTARFCGLVHPSDLHGISRVNPLKSLGL